MREQESTKNN